MFSTCDITKSVSSRLNIAFKWLQSCLLSNRSWAQLTVRKYSHPTKFFVAFLSCVWETPQIRRSASYRTVRISYSQTLLPYISYTFRASWINERINEKINALKFWNLCPCWMDGVCPNKMRRTGCIDTARHRLSKCHSSLRILWIPYRGWLCLFSPAMCMVVCCVRCTTMVSMIPEISEF